MSSRWTIRLLCFFLSPRKARNTILKETVLLNERIRAREVRAIGEEGEQLGILPLREAIRIAQERGLDLVLVAAEAQPPVCKIMDYGRHKFETEKKNREARKKQHTSTLKEVTLSYKIADHDYQVRLRRVQEFLLDGDKVKVTIRFRGREMQHQALGAGVLMRFAKDVAEIANVERDPRQEGRTLFFILAPKKGVTKERGEGKPQAEAPATERTEATP